MLISCTNKAIANPFNMPLSILPKGPYNNLKVFRRISWQAKLAENASIMHHKDYCLLLYNLTL